MNFAKLPLSVAQYILDTYIAICHVNLETDEIVAYHLEQQNHERYADCIGNGRYSVSFARCINKSVLLEDQDAIMKATDIAFLREHLSRQKVLPLHAGCLVDGREMAYDIKFVNIGKPDRVNDILLLVSECSSRETMRQFHTRPTKILVAEDNELQRGILVELLENDGYEVYAVGDGLEVLEVLKAHYKEIALVISDFFMPNCSGYDLIIKMRSVTEYQQIPVIIATGNGDKGTEFKCLRIGATDFIYKPYDYSILKKRIESILDMEDRNYDVDRKRYDSLTGLYKKKYFYSYSDRFIRAHPENEYYIVVCDIENFRNVNERYGVKTGDEVLSKMASMGAEMLPGYIMGGRLYNDVFAALVKNEERCLERFIANGQGDYKPPIPNLVVKTGAVKVSPGMTTQEMCDCAEMAINTIKNVYGTNFAMFDDTIKKNLEEEQSILNSMEDALKNHQFQIYCQPKHDLRQDITGGAEVLVRWIHPTLGFMNPGRFIDIFEKNGFIKKLDWYIWEELCRSIKVWTEAGQKLVPFSINVSRRDFEIPDLARKLIDMVDSYGIGHSQIHVEVTESACVDNQDSIAAAIREMRDAGFIIELDDFGTGYTSLTTLNSMDLDVIKLDMSLVRSYDPNSERNVMDFSVQLAKMLKLKTVAEGVETLEQKRWMQALGVDYIQGYYYSRPLPKDEFIEYLNRTC